MKFKIQNFAIVTAFALFMISSCKKDDTDNAAPQSAAAPDISEKGTNPDELVLSDDLQRHFSGFIYTEGNEAGVNMIHIFRQHADGHLTHENAVASGGAGNAAALGSQGALAFNNSKHWLFAVNAGDNTVSSFEVQSNGNLTLAHTVTSGGTTPVSLCIYNHFLYVVNSGSSNISGYTVGMGGTMTPITGSVLSLSAANAGPAQIAFSPNGRYLYVTEKMTNMITSYDVDAGGLAAYDNSIASTGVTPFGFDIARNKFLIVSNASGGAANAASCTSYSGVNPGNLTAVNGAVANNQTASCWVATTHHGRFAFVTNTGSDNISSYYISGTGSLHLIHGAAVTTQSHPIDICVAANNYYVYNLNAISHSISGYRRGFLGDLIPNGAISGLPDFASGLVAR
jgi:6-phosphogluconolactonase